MDDIRNDYSTHDDYGGATTPNFSLEFLEKRKEHFAQKGRKEKDKKGKGKEKNRKKNWKKRLRIMQFAWTFACF